MNRSHFLLRLFPKAMIVALLVQPALTPALLAQDSENISLQGHKDATSWLAWFPKVAIALGTTALTSIHIKHTNIIALERETSYRIQEQIRRDKERVLKFFSEEDQ
jgi:hypothetical protein